MNFDLIDVFLWEALEGDEEAFVRLRNKVKENIRNNDDHKVFHELEKAEKRIAIDAALRENFDK